MLTRASGEILVKGKKYGFCAEVVHSHNLFSKTFSWKHIPPKALKVHSGPQGTHGGFSGQHQRKVKNTQIYEFYHFPKNGRMQCGL